MASLVKLAKGRWQIQVMVPENGRKVRRSIRPGKMSQRSAEGLKFRIEHLVAAKASGQPLDSATADWLANLGDDLHKKIARAGLCQPREAKPASLTLGAFIESYITSRQDIKPNTVRIMRRAKALMVAFFGSDRSLDTIGTTDAEEWYQSLVGEHYAPATIGRTVKYARQFYTVAIRRGLVPINPFRELKAPGASNRDRDFFVNRDITQRVIDACPDVQWRCIVALARYGGLRCPSEILALRWQDVDWARERMRVRSSKTEHHEGKGSRWVPLFPELRCHLEEAFEQAETGDVFVITRYRQANINLRTQLLRIIDKAGCDAWPKLFQNMRATRETELCQTFPLHVVCAWIGNSSTIAAKHYLQVTEDHYAAATEGVEILDVPKKAVQKAVQQLQDNNGQDRTANS